MADEQPSVLDPEIASLRTLVDAGRYGEARTQADSLQKQLVVESTQKEEELKQATIKDDWAKVAKLAEQLKAHKRRQDILKFLSDQMADAELPETKRAHFADVAVGSLMKIEERPVTAFDHLEAAGFKLRRTSDESTGDHDKAALFGLSHDFETGSETEFAADFYLSWSPSSIKGSGRRQETSTGKESLYELSVEGHLNSVDNKAGDAWKFRAERNSIFDLKGNGHFLHLDIGAKLEADRDFDRQRLSGEIQLSPTWWDIGIGRFLPHADVLIAGKKPEAEAPVQFRWRPYLTADLGNIINGDERATDSAVWLSERLKVELALNFMKEALGVEEVTLFGDGRALYSTEGKSWHSYLEAGIDVMFSTNVGWTAFYKVGESSPNFENTGFFTTGITVKF